MQAFFIFLISIHNMKKIIYPTCWVAIIAAWQSCTDHATTATQPQEKFLHTEYIDSSVKPGDNFYLYANGKWQDTAKIPSTETETGAAMDMYRRTKDHIKIILDSLSSGNHGAGSIEQQVGDLYASGMDSAQIEKLGFDPVKPYLKQIDDIKTPKDIMQFVAQQQMENGSSLYSESVYADQKNSAFNILNFFQGGLGLPDRDYYFKNDPSTQQIVKAYHTYMRKLFILTGSDSITAAKKTEAVYALEKQMAASHKTNVELRDPIANYHKMTITELDSKMPVFGWKALVNNYGIRTDSVIVGQPDFYIKVNNLLKSVPADTWKDYLKFNVLNDAAPTLSSDFVNARFEYVGKALNGQQKIKPRWERVYQIIDNSLGDALGQIYVKKYFPEEAKKKILDLVNNLQQAFDTRISRLDWMSDSTKSKAKEKLHAFLKKIGYTDKWRDYSKVKIDHNSYFANLVSCGKNEFQYQINKVGKPVDKTEWGMTAPTINAYYNPTYNEIVFAAGILQAPFFNPDADDAVNYGAIGAIIGHEMTHGFDDQGAQYDKDGNLKNWWTIEDNSKFKEKTKLVITQYNGFTVVDTVHVNGALTSGENIADLGGMNIAYDAFKLTKQGQDTTRIDGFTPDQRFFLAAGQAVRSKEKDEYARMLINIDPHSPDKWRINGVLMNFTPFYTAFNVKEGEKMYKPEKDRIKIW